MTDALLLTLGLPESGDVTAHRLLEDLLPDHRHHFEPLHPRLIDFHHQRIHHPDTWPEDTEDPPRRALKTEWLSRIDPVEEGFEPRFGRGGFFRQALRQDPDLGAYLQRLANGDGPAHLHLNRALGRTGLLADLFPEATAILRVAHPLTVWNAWQNHPPDPFVDTLPLEVHGLKRRLYELESQLPEEEFRAWGFSAVHDAPPFARFLVTWAFLFRTALREAGRFSNLTVLSRNALGQSPRATQDRLAEVLDVSVPSGSTEVTVPESARVPSDSRRRLPEKLLRRLPDVSPVTDVLESLGYAPSVPG